MFKVLAKKDIYVAENSIKQFEILAPNIAKNAKAGQFIIVRLDEFSERIPLTIVDINKEQKSIKVIIQEIGKSTKKIGLLKVGDDIRDILGPLGRAAEIKNYGNIICIGGGVGIAAIFPIVKAMKGVGNKVISITGVRKKEMMILEKNLKKYSDKLFLTSNDGSLGEQGFVTDVLEKILDKKEKIDIIFAIGPLIMMKSVFETVKKKLQNIKQKIPVMVSLEVLMLDGIGMCGACRVKYEKENKFACMEGPIFNAEKLDFNDIMNRQKSYKNKEEIALKVWQNDFKNNCYCSKKYKI
ncbi:MAG: sulfide/dihydroorotate dehydrogenase-like FAD/NAD-binding protein [Elusimicrobiota bacterium]|jgi:ferredoxin--NADP+ reductase|nr:sulfide/dihydroorotate dehydrogenase-like FAD/NAD-binding protein [Elusimicrobiota bacterium]